MIIAATGHRPHKLSLGWRDRLVPLARRYLIDIKATGAISGMADGWDLAFAEAVLFLGLPLHAAVPFPEQPDKWPAESREHWRRILSQATHVHVLFDGPGPKPSRRFHARNVYMVDRAARVCALWNGSTGGTEHCVRYATKVGKPVDNLWKNYVRG